MESVEQILESLKGWQNLPPAVVDKFDHPLLALLHAAPQTSESLAHCTELPLAEVLAQLTELELEGRVSNEAGRWFARVG
ncbi:DprA winged helix domain protein [compost metagenome]